MANTAWPRVAIIILTWNQCALTLDCLESLAGLEYPAEKLQVILVDNGSKDGTAQAVRQAWPGVTVLENDENLGFAGGNNVGIAHALASGAEQIMLLNNDTAVDKRLLRLLVIALAQEAAVGIVGPKMLYYDQPDVIWCAGNTVDLRTGAVGRLQADEIDCTPDEEMREVAYITACCVLARRQVFEGVGQLDPRFFIYYEETDWSLRAREAGWRILYVPEARLWHKVSAAMGTTSPATDYYMHRNVLLFLAKHQDGHHRFLSITRAVMKQCMTIAAYSLKSWRGKRLPHRNVRLLALRDALLGRWGAMGPDVEAVCRRWQA